MSGFLCEEFYVFRSTVAEGGIPVIRLWKRLVTGERSGQGVGRWYGSSGSKGRGSGERGRSTAYPAWGSLQPHATLEPSISSKIYGFLVQRLLGASTHRTISRGAVLVVPPVATAALSPRRGLRAIRARALTS